MNDTFLRFDTNETGKGEVVESQKFLLEILCEKLGWRRGRWIALAIGLICFGEIGTGLITMYLYGTWVSEPIMVVISTLVASIVLVLGNVNLRNSYNETLRKIRPRVNAEAYNELKDKLLTRWLRVLFVVIVLFSLLGFALGDYLWIQENQDEVGTTPVSHGGQKGIYALLFLYSIHSFVYIIAAEGLTILINIARLPSRIKNHVEINPYSPDGCGGLSPIGRLMLKMCTLLFVLLTIATVGRSQYVSPSYSLFNFGVVVALWLFGIVLFFLPQRSFHSLLKDKKEKELARIAERIQKIKSKLEGLEETTSHIAETILSFPNSMPAPSRNEFEESIILLGLLNLKRDVENMRVTSFDTSTLKRIKLTSLLPLIANGLKYSLTYLVFELKFP